MAGETVRGSQDERPVRCAADVVFRQMGEGAVLVHLGNSRVFELNATGAAIWGLLWDGRPVATIPSLLVERFEVEPARAADELRTLLDSLQREGLLES